jgi:hypothetical protein
MCSSRIGLSLRVKKIAAFMLSKSGTYHSGNKPLPFVIKSYDFIKIDISTLQARLAPVDLSMPSFGRTLTLFQLGGADYIHQLLFPPSFESHRPACSEKGYSFKAMELD